MTAPEAEAKRLLESAGVAVPAFRTVPRAADVAVVATELRPPLVLKAGLLHKSDVGGVRLGLDQASVGPAAAQMEAALHAAGVEPDGWLVEEQQPAGVELLVGVAGPMVLLGLGGTMVEVLDQAVARLHPIDKDMALEMLQAMPGAPVLDGVRGGPAVDRDAIVSVLLAVAGAGGLVSQLGDEVAEFEINPLIATPAGAVAVDARLVRRAPGSGRALPPPAPTSFDRLFAPSSIGVVGASTSKLAFGNRFLRAYVRRGWADGLYAIHPTAASVEGVPAVPSVADVPGGLDYLLVAVPAAACADLVRSAAGRVGFAQVMSGGFREAGPAGAALEEELLVAARDAGVRVVGPNCMGVYSPAGRQTWQLRDPVEPGRVSVLSQSGSLAGDIIKAGEARGLRLSKLVTIGNAVDVAPAELVAYFAGDDATDVIGMYLEGAATPALIDALRGAGKPVVALVGGLSRQGSRAAASHTGGMAGDARVWEAVHRSLGVAVVGTLEQLVGSLTYLQFASRSGAGGVLVIGPGGGASILAADAADRAGLALETVDDGTQRQLRGLGYGEGTSVANPIEIGIGPAAAADAFDPILG
ncbi:MAG TPA: acetate--CoA ligase family protein, partial [Acidimicrobiales bacterium]|nr:acetate--CoA ligase family protein [Acidimicrobiales bacterium]